MKPLTNPVLRPCYFTSFERKLKTEPEEDRHTVTRIVNSDSENKGAYVLSVSWRTENLNTIYKLYYGIGSLGFLSTPY